MAMGRATNDTKQKLIDTALELIWKSSYGAVSVDDICKAAGVKKGSFYHFFPSKVDLAVAAMEETSRKSKSAYDEVFSAAHDPVGRFERFADFMIETQAQAAARYGHVCGCPCASLGSELAGQEAGVCAKVEEISHRQQRYFESTLRDMIASGLLPDKTDVKTKAQELSAYVMGLLTMARIQNDLGPLKRDLKPGLLQLLGIKGRAPKAA
jgi:TetR/AcrR family transcriptional repressor of nem operon